MSLMNGDLFAPYWILSGGILVTLILSMIRVETKRPAQISAITTLLFTFFAAEGQWGVSTTSLFHGAIEISSFGMMILILLCGLGILFCVGSSRYLTKEGIHYSDYYHLVLILILGSSLMAAAKDLMAFFIALEVLSIPAYTLVGFRRNDSRSNEAALKYFVMGSVLGAFYLFGCAMVFGATGSTDMSAVYRWSQQNSRPELLFLIGHSLLLIALFFKVAAVPFHFWKPDVYEGAPTAVTGIMASIVTVAAFVGVVRIVHLVDYQAAGWESYAMWIKSSLRGLAVLSLGYGALVALTQTNLKRLFAYSAIGHTGYLTLGVLSSLTQSQNLYAIWVYLIGYSLMSAGIFILMGQSAPQADAGVELIDLTGLMKRNPLQTVVWGVFLCSMAGLPFTAGFIGKYAVFTAGIDAGETVFVVIAALCVVVNAYTYLRPIALMVMRDADPQAAQWSGSVASKTISVLIALAVIALGVLPQQFIVQLKEISLSH